MSSIIQAPPPEIPIGGGGGDPGMGGGPPREGGGPHEAMAGLGTAGSENDSPVVTRLKNALTEVLKAQEGEQDDESAAGISEIASKLMKLIASEAKLVDTATGAGPGAKMIRKASGPIGGGGGPAGGTY